MVPLGRLWLFCPSVVGVIWEGLSMACAPPLIALFVDWSEPLLLRVASLCVVVTLAVLNIYLFIYFAPPLPTRYILAYFV